MSLAPGAPWQPFQHVRLDGTYAVMARPMPDEPFVFHRAVEAESLRLEMFKSHSGRLSLRILAAHGREVVLESADGLSQGQVWREEKRLIVEPDPEPVEINPDDSVRLYRLRLVQP